MTEREAQPKILRALLKATTELGRELDARGVIRTVSACAAEALSAEVVVLTVRAWGLDRPERWAVGLSPERLAEVDPALDAAALAATLAHEGCTVAEAPVVRGARTLGAMVVRWAHVGDVSDEARAVLEGFASLAAQGLALAAGRTTSVVSPEVSDDLHRAILRNYPSGAVVVFDRELRYTFAEGRGLEEVGLSRALLEGHTIDEVFPPETCAAIEGDYRAALELVKSRGLDLPFVIVSGTVSEEVAVEAMRAGAQDFLAKDRTARLVPVIERELAEAVMRAERRAMQEQLMVSERMASLGTLAAGVAHEINNPLAVVLLSLDFAMEGLDHPARLEALQEARDAAERVRMIVRDLKVLSRPAEDSHSAVDVRRVLDATVRMAQNEIRHRAVLVREDAEVPLVAASEARLGQIFLNLLVNAAQAIPAGNSAANTIRVRVSTDARGDVVVEVSDTGVGIDERHRAHVFEPFFTTKPVGVGTGLGLSICHRLVTALGGTITFESKPGVGTTFRTTLPPARGDRVAPLRSSAPPPPSGLPRGRVLVIDDEHALARLVARMLEPEHAVTVCTRARDALDAILSGGFDVVLCDLMMPDMTGMDLIEALRVTQPAQADRVVLMTGGAFTERARAFLSTAPNPRLEKPFDAPAALAAVRALLP